MSMEERYADWSPASIFGATPATPLVARAAQLVPKKPPRRVPHDEYAADVAVGIAVLSNNHCNGNNGHNNVKSGMTAILPRQNEENEGARVVDNAHDDRRGGEVAIPRKRHRKSKQGLDREHAQRDYAARVLQRYGQLFLLYRHERAAMQQLAGLRAELENASCVLISNCYRRYKFRKAVHQLLLSMRLRLKKKARARQLLAVWLYLRRYLRLRNRRREFAAKRLVEWCQSTLQMKRAQQERRCQINAVRRIQSQARTWLRRCHFKNLMTEVTARRRILSTYRGYKRRQEARVARSRRVGRQQALCVLAASMSLVVQRHHLRCWADAVARCRQEHSAARTLQRLFHVLATASLLLRRRESAVNIQRVLRGRAGRKHARVLKQRKDEYLSRQQQHTAATSIQRMIRGFLARRRLQRYRKYLRERFQCTNCGQLEPGGVYCKQCGRKRVNFDLLPPSIAIPAFDSKSTTVHKPKQPKALQQPAQLSSPEESKQVNTLQSRKNMSTRWLQGVKSMSSQSLPVTSIRVQTFAVADVIQLPEVSPGRGGGNQTDPSTHRRPHRPVARSGSDTAKSPRQLQQLHTVSQTRERAVNLVALQSKRDESLQSSALAMHLQRIHKGTQAANRSR